MRECTDCHKPPGGRVCCDGGLTPMCYIEEGEPIAICLDLSRNVSESLDLLTAAIVDSIAEHAGEGYREDASQNILFVDGILSYESTDGRIKVRAKQVLAERGSLGGLAPMA